MVKFILPCGWDADLQSTLITYPPHFSFKSHLQLDYFRYIGHLPLYLLLSGNDDLENYNFSHNVFVPVNKRFLDNMIPDYRKYLDYLVLHGLILENRHYIVNQKSGSLAYPPKYSVCQFELFECTRKNLVTKIMKLRRQGRLTKSVNGSDNFVVDHLSYWVSRLQLDINTAVQINESIYANESENPAYYIPESSKHTWSDDESVQHIIKRDFIRNLKIYTFNHVSLSSCIQDGTSGRFHSKLTRLDKSFRTLVHLDGTQRLEEIDIKNSQIFLLLSFLDVETFLKNNMYKYILEFNKDIDSALPTYLEKSSKLHPLFATNIQRTLDSHLCVDDDLLEKNNMCEKSIDNTNITYYNNTSFVLLLDLIANAERENDVILFKEWVRDGTFYERFMEVLNESGYEFNSGKPCRDQVKEIVFTVLFGKTPVTTTHRVKLAFKNLFPTVYRIIGAVKCGRNPKSKSYEKKRRSHRKNVDSPSRTLACALQSLESEIILNTICGEIIRKDDSIPLFTIHDSIITLPEHIEYVTKVMNDSFIAKMGYAPKLRHKDTL